MRYKIKIKNLTFKTIIGLLDFERVQKQTIILNACIIYDKKEDFLNYALIAKCIKTEIKKGGFFLIEEALEAIFLTLKKRFKAIQKAKIEIEKPHILNNCQVSVTGKKKW